MPIPAEYEDLLENLLSKSRRGTVEWREAAGNKSKFYIAFSRFALEMFDGTNNDDSGFIVVALRGDSGNPLDSFWVDEGDAGYGQLRELHALARRKARRIDVALAELKAELDSENPGSSGTAHLPKEEDDIPF